MGSATVAVENVSQPQRTENPQKIYDDLSSGIADYFYGEIARARINPNNEEAVKKLFIEKAAKIEKLFKEAEKLKVAFLTARLDLEIYSGVIANVREEYSEGIIDLETYKKYIQRDFENLKNKTLRYKSSGGALREALKSIYEEIFGEEKAKLMLERFDRDVKSNFYTIQEQYDKITVRGYMFYKQKISIDEMGWLSAAFELIRSNPDYRRTLYGQIQAKIKAMPRKPGAIARFREFVFKQKPAEKQMHRSGSARETARAKRRSRVTNAADKQMPRAKPAETRAAKGEKTGIVKTITDLFKLVRRK